MTAYASLFRARFLSLLQYRAAAAAGFGTQLFWGLIRVMIYDAFYRSTTVRQPMSQEDVVTYVWLGQAFFALLPWWVDTDVRDMVHTGTVAYELVRPVDLYWLWYTRSMASRIAPTILRAAPMIVVAGLCFGLRPSPSMASFLAWLLALGGALLLGCAISTLMTISLLWTVSGDGVSRGLPAIMYTLSGMLIPLAFFPAWLQPTLDFLPFRDMIDIPFRVYLGTIGPNMIAEVLLHQIAWTITLVLFGRWLLYRGSRRLVVQGG